MSLWGNNDLVGKGGTVGIDLVTEDVTGAGTSFATSGYVVSEGDVIVVGAGASYGYAVISSVTGNNTATVASIATTQYLIPHPTTGIITGATYFVTQLPVSSLENSVYAAPVTKTTGFSTSRLSTQVFGVDSNEVGAAATITVGGKASAYAVSHSGWVGIMTYIDADGNFRVKSEVLVAGGIDVVNGKDADDDSRFPDPVITILTDVDDEDVITTGIATFTVSASVFPEYSPLSYQWYEDTTVLTNGGDYSGVTTPTLYVQNNDDKDDGREYKVVITSGYTSVTSGVGTITYL